MSLFDCRPTPLRYRTRVPDLHGHQMISHYHVLGHEIGACLGVGVSAMVTMHSCTARHTNSCLVAFFVGSFDVTLHERCLPHTTRVTRMRRSSWIDPSNCTYLASPRMRTLSSSFLRVAAILLLMSSSVSVLIKLGTSRQPQKAEITKPARSHFPFSRSALLVLC